MISRNTIDKKEVMDNWLLRRNGSLILTTTNGQGGKKNGKDKGFYDEKSDAKKIVS